MMDAKTKMSGLIYVRCVLQGEILTLIQKFNGFKITPYTSNGKKITKFTTKQHRLFMMPCEKSPFGWCATPRKRAESDRCVFCEKSYNVELSPNAD